MTDDEKAALASQQTKMNKLEFYEKLSITRGVMICICGEEVACYHIDCLTLCPEGLELLERRRLR